MKSSLANMSLVTSVTSSTVGSLSGALGAIVCEWLGASPRSFLGLVIWTAVIVSYIVWETRFVRARSWSMREYATARGAASRSRGMEAEIIPFVGIFAFFAGMSALAGIAGFFFWTCVDQPADWAPTVFGVACAIHVLTAISATLHGQYVKRIENALNAEKDGWQTFHRWSPRTFREIL